MSKLNKLAKALIKASAGTKKPNSNINNSNIPHNQFNSKNYIEQGGISLNYPDGYLIANIPLNAPDCVVALAKDDGLCDIMIELSRFGRINYQKDVFERTYADYIRGLGFYAVKYIDGFGSKKVCLQALNNSPMGIIKSTIYFDFNLKKDIRITLNTLKQVDYDCINDLKVIANSIRCY